MKGPWHLKVHIHWRKLCFYSGCLATFVSWRCYCWCYKSYQASVVHNSIVGWRWEMWDSNESMTAMVWYDDINTTVTRHRHWHMKNRCPLCPLCPPPCCPLLHRWSAWNSPNETWRTKSLLQINYLDIKSCVNVIIYWDQHWSEAAVSMAGGVTPGDGYDI